MYLLGSVVISVTALLLVIYVPMLQGIFHTMPIGIGQWLIIVFFSGIISLINSIATFVGNRA